MRTVDDPLTIEQRPTRRSSLLVARYVGADYNRPATYGYAPRTERIAAYHAGVLSVALAPWPTALGRRSLPIYERLCCIQPMPHNQD